jgi:Zn-finger nucleic acid-binding protein
MSLTCPKCHDTMQAYERDGVHVDRCAGCRGVFLDRGELERLLDTDLDKALDTDRVLPMARYDGRRDYHNTQYRGERSKRRTSVLDALFDD